MKTTTQLLFAVLLAGAVAAPVALATSSDPLFTEIASLDEAAFEAFNRCKDPAQLRKYGTYFAPDLEFYHDNAGATWSSEVMLANTAKNACGVYTRELIPGTLKVFPIKGFGAISQGSHRFCHFASGKCEGLADFTIIWRLKDGQWQMTRVMSYGHRATQ